MAGMKRRAGRTNLPPSPPKNDASSPVANGVGVSDLSPQAQGGRAHS